MTDRPQRVVFDLTTSAQWGRPAVGVVQTERELGRFAPDVVDSVVEYSVYDASRNAFHRLRREAAAEVLNGRAMLMIRESRARWRARLARRAGEVAWSRLRSIAPNRAGPGSPVGPASPTDGATVPTIPLGHASDGELALCADDVVVSCGADWEGKDLDAIAAMKQRDGFAYVSICYDLIPWKHPDFWPPGVADAVVSHYARLAGVADVVMCISEASARDYEAFCHALDIAAPRMATFRLGDLPSEPSVDAPLPPGLDSGRYVLCVGSLEPRKNHRLLYELWDGLASQTLLPSDLKLVFAASARWMTDELLHEISRNGAVRDRIAIVDDVSDAQLHALYSSSLFTVYPSFEEGWGLPVAESLSHGKVCLASNRGGVAEISDLVVLLDPYDLDAWRAAILRYITDEPARTQLERRIREEFEPTPWSTSARSFFAAALAAV